MGVLLEIMGYIFVEFLFNQITLRAYKTVLRTIKYLKQTIFGSDNSTKNQEAEIESEFLYRIVRLKEGLNPKLPEGSEGTVLHVLAPENYLVEFLEENGNTITYENEIVFMVVHDQIEFVD